MDIINNKQASIWVSASAGTGKTKITIDRILALLESGVAPEKILAITFTNKAAAEMQERVANLINRKGFSDYSYRLKIQTIHSFCQNILESFPFEAGLRPGFKIIDNNYAKELLEIAKEDLFANSAITPIIQEFIEDFHYDIITEILNEIINQRVKIEYILAGYEDFNNYKDKLYEFLNLKENENFKIDIDAKLQDSLDLEFLKELQTNIAERGGKSDISKLADLNLLIAQPMSLSNFQSFFCNKKNEFLKRVVTSAVAKEVVNYESRIETLRSLYEQQFNLYQKHQAAELTENLLLIAQIFIKNYNALKAKQNLIDYEDIILRTIELLKHSEHRDNILYKYDLTIEHLLLDEAQDTSPWQWEVINLLLTDLFSGRDVSYPDGEQSIMSESQSTNNSKLNKSFFIVGDEKQSIYSFQGADHKLFSKVKAEYADKLDAIGSNLHTLDLQTSYRSQAPILKLVDDFFNDNKLRSKLVESDQQIEHKIVREDNNPELQLWPKMKGFSKAELPYFEYPKNIVRKSSKYDEQARNIASFIKSKLAETDKNASTGKAIEAQDILILARERNQIYDSVINALEQAGISVQSDKSYKLLDQVIIMDLVGFLKYVYFPDDDLNLAAILKSPLFNKSEEELFEICHNREERPVCEVVKNNTQDVEKLENLQEMANILDLEGFYLHILETIGLRHAYLENYGRKAASIIELFLNIVTSFAERDSDKKKFLEFIHSYEIMAKSEIVSDLNNVQLMTMHQSKGLQAPLVIVLLDKPKTKGKRDYLNIDYANKLILSNSLSKVAEFTTYFDGFKDKNEAEEMRLLYVALTRARDSLHIVPFSSEKEEDWVYDKLAELCPAEELKINNEGLKVEKSKSDNNNISLPKAANNSKFKIQNSKLPPASQSPGAKTGSIYHDLFNYLCRGGAVDNLRKFTEITHKNYPQNEAKEIVENVTSIYQDQSFKYIFEERGYSELALSMKEGEGLLTGRIDRVIINNYNAEIIDYKFESGQTIKPEYQAQLDLYEKLIKANYPEITNVTKKLFYIPSRRMVTL